MAKSKKPSAAEARRLVLYEQNVREVGMGTYNAALAAGYPHAQALSMQAESMLTEASGVGTGFKDIAERKGVTPSRIIEYLARRAGFFDREEGAKKVVSLVPAMKKMMVAKSRGTNKRDRLAEPDDADLERAPETDWDWVEVPDDGIQQKYMAQLLEFLQYTGQAKAGNQVPVGSGARSISLHFHVKEDEQKQIMHNVVEEIRVNGTEYHPEVDE